jgi:hypothetical protein
MHRRHKPSTVFVAEPHADVYANRYWT